MPVHPAFSLRGFDPAPRGLFSFQAACPWGRFSLNYSTVEKRGDDKVNKGLIFNS
jgi:hypothetical protein